MCGAGSFRTCFIDTFGATLSFVSKLPWTWQARIRISSITGVFEASDNRKACSTQRTMVGKSGRGSISQIADFIA